MRYLYIDIIKLIAIVCVVACHVFDIKNPNGIVYSTDSVMSHLYIIIGKTGVPLFAMSTGALVLNKCMSTKESIIHFYKNNFFTLYITSLIWFFIYAFINRGDFSLKAIVNLCFFIVKPEVHLWYVKMILFYYLFMPLIIYLLEKRPKVLYLISGMIFIGVFLYNGYDFLVNNNMIPTKSGFSTLSFLVYLVIGSIIHKNRSDCNFRSLFIPCFLIFTCIWILVVSIEQGKINVLWYDNPFILCMGVSAFILIKQIFTNRQSNRLATELSNMTFGVYLCHILFIHILSLPLFKLFGGYTPLTYILFQLIILVISFVAVRITKMTPTLSKVLFRY